MTEEYKRQPLPEWSEVLAEKDAEIAALNHAEIKCLVCIEEKDLEIKMLRTRLEVDERHPYDGVYCRDETIRLQDAEITRLTAEVERLRAALKLDKPRAAWADAIQKNGRLCEEIEWLRAVVDVADKLQNGIRAATSLTAENKKLRAALLVARKYVLVQSCELSLMPEDAARDLDVIDEALEEDDD